jgi:hypothetical protein
MGTVHHLRPICSACGHADHAPCRSCPDGHTIYERRHRHESPDGGLFYHLFLIGAGIFLLNLAVAASFGVWRLMFMPPIQ